MMDYNYHIAPKMGDAELYQRLGADKNITTDEF